MKINNFTGKVILFFQAPCQVELENWVNSIHSACGAAFARHRGKIGTLHLLQEEIYRIEKQVEAVCTFKFKFSKKKLFFFFKNVK